MLFKYEDVTPKVVVDDDAKSNIKFHQKRRNTLSRDRVPTRKGCSRARRKRFNAFAQNNQHLNVMEFGDQVHVYSDYNCADQLNA